jgi:two-component system cell cycle response regulator
MTSDTQFDGGATARFQAEELKKYKLDQKSPTLVVLLGSDAGLRIPLSKPEVTLGRTTEADFLLHDAEISRRHALIRCDPERRTYTLVDLKSTNGTRVNLEQVTEAALKEGDKIFLGSTVLKFMLQDELESEHVDVLHRLAFTDDLTGLVAKRRFTHQLQFQIQRALDSSERLALLMMDLDGLKQINDAHGHAMGAYIIAQAGGLIGEIVNPLGQACRYGGDEFTAYLLRHDAAGALGVGERIRSTIEARLFEKDGKSLKISISIGVAVLPEAARDTEAARDPEALNKAADEALYRAKAKGRNCVSD